MKKSDTFPEITSFLLILLFSYTALDKSLRPDIFQISLGQSPVLAPHRQFIGWIIPGVEYLATALLIFSRKRKLAFLFSLLLLTAFTFYIIYILVFAKSVPCACGGVISLMTWTQHLIFNLFFIALTLISLYLTTRHKPVRYYIESPDSIPNLYYNKQA